MEEKKEKEPVLKNKIRLDIIFKTIVHNWRKFIWPMVGTVIISSALALCIPRYYTVKVMLAPEYDNGSGSLGSLGGLASMVGINMGGITGSDAISPTFYPDLMGSTDFLVPLMQVKVTTLDSTFQGTYAQYLNKKIKFPWWTMAKIKLIRLFKAKKAPMSTDPNYRPDPFKLTLAESDMLIAMGGYIGCQVDKKTEVITLTTTAQDPLVAALMADTVKQHLQDFITGYRTSKARNDLEHITKLCDEARQKYQATQQEYAQFVDSHRDLSMQAYRIVEEKYQNEAQLALSSYNAILQQKLLAEAKVQERTPAFTTLQNASVPVKHTGPKRMLGVAAITFLAFIVTAIVVVMRRKE